MPENDSRYHILFSHPMLVAELLRDVIQPPWIDGVDLTTLGRANFKLHGRGLAGPRRREGDLLWRLRHRSGADVYVYFLLELQSAVDPWMAVRLLVYIGLLYQQLVHEDKLWEGKLPPIFPVVLYNGQPRWTAATELRQLIAAPGSPGLNDYQPGLRYHVVDEARHPREALEVHPGVVSGLLTLTQVRSGPAAQARFEEVLRLLAETRYAPVRDTVVTYLEDHAVTRALLGAEVDLRGLVEGGASMLSETVKLWEEQRLRAEEETRRAALQQGLAEGREGGLKEGLKEGRQVGLKEGLQEGQREAILGILQARFGGPASPGLRDALGSVRDGAILGELIALAATAPSAEAFRAELTRRGLR